ncbi:MAG: tRNA preQ1(34) S-adenosylmethionine ribosyltransferase-isomerase QueA [Thermodesulfobacteriota bacterium]|nr:tRNA preQ1(34) S-adenosylmethionine ribosyltransferase-isomerase QueA [Thermodesulfobacteriota bacterium]
MFSLSDYNYDLPEEFIAQQPVKQRDRSKLLFLKRNTGDLSHHQFSEIYKFLLPGDVLILNNTEVIPGRLLGQKETGGKAEVLILDYAGGKEGSGKFTSECLINASKPTKTGAFIFFGHDLKAEVTGFFNGVHSLKFYYRGNFESLLYKMGKIPLPPYIKRKEKVSPCNDKTAYQTVYACEKGAIAAPTAGFHFTKALFEKLKSRGVEIAAITLHVGYGTFLPVRSSDIRNHRMHSERFFIPEPTAALINHAKKEGRRIIAVGTTCVRTLEFAAGKKGTVQSGNGTCNLFIYPGYTFKAVDAMITNFHLPKSTLLMLVSAFAGKENVLCAYKDAIKNKYRFYSYGDAMYLG